MGSTLFRDPQALSSTLASLGMLQPLNRVDPLDSVSNYYVICTAAPLASQSESAEAAPYLLFTNYHFIHQVSLDGSRLRTIISEPNQYIFTLDYHSR